MGEIWKKCNIYIIIFWFIRRVWVFGRGLLTRLEIMTDALELFLPICLILTLFSWIVLAFGGLLVSSSDSAIRFCLKQIA